MISNIFVSLGPDSFSQFIRSISIGKLKTYQLYDGLKARTRLTKLNVESLRKASGRLWERVSAHDEDLARDLAQAVLLSRLDVIVAILDFIGIPHTDGFFANDIDPKAYLSEGWGDRVVEHFKETYPEPFLRFYIAHLELELNSPTPDDGAASRQSR
ncbi:MAG TPA: hypothetical protein VFY29_05825 [Terriglobia bacterium]|nr:hypothetical protein [Terriglobia bacterium]